MAITYTYQWQRSSDDISWTDIPGATDDTYVITESDINDYLRSAVTADNGLESDTAFSNSLGPVITLTSSTTLNARVVGQSVSVAVYDASVVGQTVSSLILNARVVGQSTSATSYDAKLVAQATSSAARVAKVAGRALSNSQPYSVRLNAFVPTISSSPRDVGIVGYSTSNTTRAIETIGKATSSSLRVSRITGQASLSTVYGVRITGRNFSSYTQVIRVDGGSLTSQNYSARLVGTGQFLPQSYTAIVTGRSSRSHDLEARIVAYDTSEVEYSTRLTGQSSLAYTSNVNTVGKLGSSLVVSSNTVGEADDAVAYPVHTTGMDTSAAGYAVKLSSEGRTLREIVARVTGELSFGAHYGVALMAVGEATKSQTVSLLAKDIHSNVKYGVNVVGQQRYRKPSSFDIEIVKTPSITTVY